MGISYINTTIYSNNQPIATIDGSGNSHLSFDTFPYAPQDIQTQADRVTALYADRILHGTDNQGSSSAELSCLCQMLAENSSIPIGAYFQVEVCETRGRNRNSYFDMRYLHNIGLPEPLTCGEGDIGAIMTVEDIQALSTPKPVAPKNDDGIVRMTLVRELPKPKAPPVRDETIYKMNIVRVIAPPAAKSGFMALIQSIANWFLSLFTRKTEMFPGSYTE